MLTTSDAYKQAILSHAPQYIFGSISAKNGELIYLADNIVGTPTISKQCTAAAEEFAIGETYTGTASLTVDLPADKVRYIRNGALRLSFRAGNSELIELGRWKINNCRRDASGTLTISAVDCIALLDVEINESYVGIITLESRMQKVTELTGVEFAQTPEEIYEMLGGGTMYYGTRYMPTCRLEVGAIARLIGGFACDDGEGKIIFKRFGTSPVKTIPADQRHSISLAEYTFGLRGVGCELPDGSVVTQTFGEEKDIPDVAVAVYGDQQPYYAYTTDNDIRHDLAKAAANLSAIPDWMPGEIECYSDPSLELGDVVRLTNGILNEDVNFLITGIYWQFRGPMTLISAGIAEGGSMAKQQAILIRGGGDTLKYELIETIEIEQSGIAAVRRSHNTEGDDYDLDKILVTIELPNGAAEMVVTTTVNGIIHGCDQTIGGRNLSGYAEIDCSSGVAMYRYRACGQKVGRKECTNQCTVTNNERKR